jgi:excinuclease ABC subunit A
VRPWAQRHTLRHQQMLEALEKHYRFSVHTPFKDLPDEVQNALLLRLPGAGPSNFPMITAAAGSHEARPFPGVIPWLRSATRRPTPLCAG